MNRRVSSIIILSNVVVSYVIACHCVKSPGLGSSSLAQALCKKGTLHKVTMSLLRWVAENNTVTMMAKSDGMPGHQCLLPPYDGMMLQASVLLTVVLEITAFFV